MIGVYVIKNRANGKVYVGQSGDVQSRFYEHRTMLRRGVHHNAHLQRAWIKYGETAFIFEIVEECPRERLDDRENFWIAELRAAKRGVGYNVEESARGTGPRSPETCHKISEAKRGKVDPVKSAEYGRRARGVSKRPRSEEHRAKLARSGEANPQFGTCWIHKGTLNKKIPRNELADHEASGWLAGRFISQCQKDAMLRGRKRT